MKGRGAADIVFVVDASGSMEPCIAGLKEHVTTFVDALNKDANHSWDIRLDFLAHDVPGEGLFRARSIFESSLLPALYGGQGRFFTADAAVFQNALGEVQTGGDECSMVALDCALDFPWRPSEGCHRVVVLLSDEPLEGGRRLEESMQMVNSVIAKLQELRILLFLVAPESEGFESLSTANRCEWNVIQGDDGLVSVDFRKLMESISKSVSVSTVSQGKQTCAARRALFGQDNLN